jgi:hypothetical protein
MIKVLEYNDLISKNRTITVYELREDGWYFLKSTDEHQWRNNIKIRNPYLITKILESDQKVIEKSANGKVLEIITTLNVSDEFIKVFLLD